MEPNAAPSDFFVISVLEMFLLTYSIQSEVGLCALLNPAMGSE